MKTSAKASQESQLEELLLKRLVIIITYRLYSLYQVYCQLCSRSSTFNIRVKVIENLRNRPRSPFVICNKSDLTIFTKY